MIRTQAIEPEPLGLVRYLNATPGGRTEVARLVIVRGPVIGLPEHLRRGLAE